MGMQLALLKAVEPVTGLSTAMREALFPMPNSS